MKRPKLEKSCIYSFNFNCQCWLNTKASAFQHKMLKKLAGKIVIIQRVFPTGNGFKRFEIKCTYKSQNNSKIGVNMDILASAFYIFLKLSNLD